MSVCSGRALRSLRRWGAATTLLLAASGLGAVGTAAPAVAATYTPQGVRCTKVGTAGDDVLVGTPNRDVICGLRGDDVIKGRGGNDLIAAGAGSDQVDAGNGSDVVQGGAGADDASGGKGADRLRGGGGGDELHGGAGNDDLHGQDGNDDLDGGSGADEIIGGDGTNWCVLDSLDTSTRCKYDEKPAEATAVEISPTSVDVTDGDRRVSVRVHVVDDTGAAGVAFTAYDVDTGEAHSLGSATLVSGTVRDGWWEAQGLVRQWTEPGTFQISVDIRDRVRRWSYKFFPETYTVVNENPDTVPPELTLRRPTTSAVFDVREASQTVTVETRVTDAQSGVAYPPMSCLYKPADGRYTAHLCRSGKLVSGDVHDGIYRVQIEIPQGEIGGDWNLYLYATDNAHRVGQQHWLGPDLWAESYDGGTQVDPAYRQLPDGAGRFSVLGTTDSYAPSVSGARITPSQVDTLPGPARVDFEVDATDAPDEGIESVSVVLEVAEIGSSQVGFEVLDLGLSRGTRTDGTWTGAYWIPQGTPPGTYYLRVMVEDKTHDRWYYSPGWPSAADWAGEPLSEPAEVVVVDSGQG